MNKPPEYSTDSSDMSARGNQNAQLPQLNQPYKFTPEEMRVLKQCNSESFYQRSLPLGSVLAVATYYGVQAGYLKPHTRFGPTPKVICASIVGYFLGKFSYQEKCAEKIMALPNSPLAEILRQRKKGGIIDSLSLDPGFNPPQGLESYETKEPPQQTHLNIDADRPYQAGLSESNRPSLDDMAQEEEIPLPPGAPSTTYEELRRKNRDDYENQRKYNRFPQPPDDMPGVSRTRIPVDSPRPAPTGEKTKYGDVWEQ